LGDFNGDGQQDLATGNYRANTVSILIKRTSVVVVNTLVTFEPVQATFTFSPDSTGCPADFAGTFSFEARLTNASERSLSALVVTVATLTNDNLLQNADSAPGGVGAQLPVPHQDGFSDGLLSPEQFVDVPFIICLTQRRSFRFVVDVFGVVDAGADAHVRAQLGR
jgi:FG-GAP repeat protein